MGYKDPPKLNLTVHFVTKSSIWPCCHLSIKVSPKIQKLNLTVHFVTKLSIGWTQIHLAYMLLLWINPGPRLTSSIRYTWFQKHFYQDREDLDQDSISHTSLIYASVDWVGSWLLAPLYNLPGKKNLPERARGEQSEGRDITYNTNWGRPQDKLYSLISP